METRSDGEEESGSEKERKSCWNMTRSVFELHRWTSTIRLEIEYSNGFGSEFIVWPLTEHLAILDFY